MTISRGVSAVILRWENKLKIYSDNFSLLEKYFNI
jgi:hypothetical protein